MSIKIIIKKQELSKRMDPQRNLFVSPFSVAAVLSMLNVGAMAETARQLQQVLNFDNYGLTELEINQQVGALLRSIKVWLSMKRHLIFTC